MAVLTRVENDELEAFLAAYRRGPLAEARGLEAGTVNTSYAIDLSKECVFLRIYEEQGLDGARREAALLAHLASAGVPTPAPIPTADGEIVRVLAGKPAALFPWVDGEMLCQRAVTPEAAREAGRALARVHLAGAPAGLAFGEGRFRPADLVARCDRVAVARDEAARALAEPLRRAVEETSARRRGDLPSGLVHGDLFRDNVLWQDGRMAALLDFESAHHGAFAYDLSVMVLSWCFGSELSPGLARPLVAGYREVRELAAEEREGIFDEAVFATLRFTITRITDDAARVGKRWERFVARREALARLGARGFRGTLGL